MRLSVFIEYSYLAVLGAIKHIPRPEVGFQTRAVVLARENIKEHGPSAEAWSEARAPAGDQDDLFQEVS